MYTVGFDRELRSGKEGSGTREEEDDATLCRHTDLKATDPTLCFLLAKPPPISKAIPTFIPSSTKVDPFQLPTPFTQPYPQPIPNPKHLILPLHKSQYLQPQPQPRPTLSIPQPPKFQSQSSNPTIPNHPKSQAYRTFIFQSPDHQAP
ncbi:hypothetical protein JAAARDRAFT_200346 [Jaapia argillacea MUCL 33604]|uniref:Uncharacterized protein n=1 Tax=Jaapia argillacea MUCL 33604 TaxID=933084 RepID=A0A067PG83_9AGAM|nr:hypothetical protein JAAARDRAFT_200346 [Jaapia argillacea MUCL 33604]